MADYNSNYSRPIEQSGKAIAVMVLGIASLPLLCGYGIGLIPAIVALAMAPSARREISAANGQLGGKGFLTAGVACSWVTVGMCVTGLVIGGVVAIIAAIAN